MQNIFRQENENFIHKKMQNILKCILHVCKTLQNVLTLVKIDVLVNEKKVTQ